MQISEPVNHARPAARLPEIRPTPSDTPATADRQPERRAREMPSRAANPAKSVHKPRLYGAGF